MGEDVGAGAGTVGEVTGDVIGEVAVDGEGVGEVGEVTVEGEGVGEGGT